MCNSKRLGRDGHTYLASVWHLVTWVLWDHPKLQELVFPYLWLSVQFRELLREAPRKSETKRSEKGLFSLILLGWFPDFQWHGFLASAHAKKNLFDALLSMNTMGLQGIPPLEGIWEVFPYALCRYALVPWTFPAFLWVLYCRCTEPRCARYLHTECGGRIGGVEIARCVVQGGGISRHYQSRMGLEDIDNMQVEM